jgi:multidrug efflux system membrane fusion protein
MDDQHADLQPPPIGPVPEPAVVPAMPTVPPLARVPQHRPILRRALFWLILLVLAGIAIRFFPWPGPGTESGRRFASGGPVSVGIARVTKGDMPVALSGLGTVTPLATVMVRTQLNGQLTAVGFKEGQLVQKGDFLAQIDPRPYQVALEQAQGQLGKDEALLKNARVDLNRYNTLVAQNSIARQTRDTQVSLVAQYEATVQADRAQIDAQKLNLTYARIISPVTGRVGLRQVDPGNYVQTSDPNGIVVVTQLQPISVIFTLPEDDLPRLMKRLHAGAVLPVTAFDRSGAAELATGRLATVDNQIDPTTGTVKLRADFTNEDDALFPNQFVNIRLLVDTERGVSLVPVAAIQRGAPGTYVYVVGADRTVTAQPVKLGPGDARNVAVLSGLSPGQQVVVDGAERLRPGAKVQLAAAEQEPGAAADKSGRSFRGGPEGRTRNP